MGSRAAASQRSSPENDTRSVDKEDSRSKRLPWQFRQRSLPETIKAVT